MRPSRMFEYMGFYVLMSLFFEVKAGTGPEESEVHSRESEVHSYVLSNT